MEQIGRPDKKDGQWQCRAIIKQEDINLLEEAIKYYNERHPPQSTEITDVKMRVLEQQIMPISLALNPSK